MAAAKAADPIPAYRKALLERQISESELDAIDAQIMATIEEAVTYALDSDYPDADEIRIDVLETEIAA
jgi:pyruvate dehydrogenase E1 component alpha subunit